jgi:DNA-binding XRE family transcriptional regulator
MKNREMVSRLLKARYLVIIKGYSQKEVSKIVGVSEKTMSTWSKKYKWNDVITRDVKNLGGLNVFMELFFMYVNDTSPEQQKTVMNLWYGFLKSYEKQIE